MNFDVITEKSLKQLREIKKQVNNPTAKWKEKPGHRQKDYKLVGSDYIFRLFLRQNIFDEQDFSCGIAVIKPDGTSLILSRYNGLGHKHGDIHYKCHIHTTTSKAIELGKKPESFADETIEYQTLDGALYCLIRDYNISGLIDIKPDHPDLFGAK